MAIQAIATLGLRTRGFLSTLATSQGAWARFGRTVGAAFGKNFAGSAGQALGFLAINKLFSPKPKAGGPQGTLENVTGLDPTMRGVRHRIRSALLAGVLGGGAVGAMGIHRATKVKDMSDVSDLSIRDAQEADRAARRSGRSFDDVALALSNMGAARREAAEGNTKLRDTFRAYKVTLEQLEDPQKTNLDLLKQMGGAIDGIQLTPRQRDDLRDLLGRSGDKMGPTMRMMSRESGALHMTPSAVMNIERGVNIVKGLGSEGKNLAGNVTGGLIGKALGVLDKPGVKKFMLGARLTALALLPKSVSGLGSGGTKPPPGSAATSMYDDKAVIEAAEMEMDAQKMAKDLAFARLSPGRQEAELNRRLEVHLDEVGKLKDEKDPQVQKIRAQHLMQQMGIVDEMIKLQSPNPEQADALARVGGFAQGAGGVAPNATAVMDVINAINDAKQGIVVAINEGGF